MKWWHWALFAAVVAMGEATRRLVTGYLKGQPFSLEIQSIGGGFYLARVAVPAFNAMRAAAAQEGVYFTVNGAWRSQDQQVDLERRYAAGETGIGKPAKAGYSNHQAGLAVDIESAGGTNPAFWWLTNNAHLYGFHRTVNSEPWHWEYTEPWAGEAVA